MQRMFSNKKLKPRGSYFKHACGGPSRAGVVTTHQRSCVTNASCPHPVRASLVSRSVVSDSLQPARLLCPWHSPGKNTGVGCRALLQGIFLTQGSNPHFLHFRWILSPSEPPEKPLKPQGVPKLPATLLSVALHPGMYQGRKDWRPLMSTFICLFCYLF